jgi:hypothetical protein
MGGEKKVVAVFEVVVGGGGISWLELTKDPRQRDLKKEDRKNICLTSIVGGDK